MLLTIQISDDALDRLKEALQVSEDDYDRVAKAQPRQESEDASHRYNYAVRMIQARKALDLSTMKADACQR